MITKKLRLLSRILVAITFPIWVLVLAIAMVIVVFYEEVIKDIWNIAGDIINNLWKE